MKRLALLLLPLSVLPFAPQILAAQSNQDNPPEDPGPARPGSQKTISEIPLEHRRLKEEVGIWAAEIQSFVTPGMPPVLSSGHEVNYMLGDAWLISDFTSSHMGQATQSHRQISFDIERAKAVGTSIDSESASLLVLEGTYDLARRERTFVYEKPGPDDKPLRFRATSRIRDTEHRTLRVVQLGPDDKETPITYIDFHLESRD